MCYLERVDHNGSSCIQQVLRQKISPDLQEKSKSLIGKCQVGFIMAVDEPQHFVIRIGSIFRSVCEQDYNVDHCQYKLANEYA
jgi:hypothetical protein